MLSSRVQKIGESSPLVINKRVLELKRAGKEIISFGIGEPNFNVPDEAKEAVIRAVHENFSRYTSSDGLPELKQAIIKKLKEENGVEYEAQNIIASAGAKQCVYQAIHALVNPGDEVILPAPYWVSYFEDINLAGGLPVIVKTGADFVLRADELRPQVTEKTKLIIVNSPNNPTGAIIPEGELKKIAALAAEKNIFMLSDEVYEYFCYDGAKHTSIASLGVEIKNLTLTINGVSKSFGMTGWRLGYAAGPAEVIAGMKKIQDQITSNPSSLSQKAAIAALPLGYGWMAGKLGEFKKKRDFVCQKLGEMGIAAAIPDGAFYVFFNVAKFYTGGITDSVKFCEDLLDRAGVALIPGADFGDDRCVRLSYAASWDDLERGMEKIKDYLKNYQ
ncbi:MAG: pyridoxal phosphate-dependent aminotransferase [Patescibacteria group bacterium]